MGEALAEAARRSGVSDQRILTAIAELPRAPFLPEDQRDRAEEDVPLPIGHGQTASQPSLQARMVEALELDGTENVLEVGTGAGYQTALLSRLAHRVWSIDIDPLLSARAGRALSDAGVHGIELVVGDGMAGCPQGAPFDGIVISFTVEGISDQLGAQLAERGRVVAPIAVGDEGSEEPGHRGARLGRSGRRSGLSQVTVLQRVGSRLERRTVLCDAWFVGTRTS